MSSSLTLVGRVRGPALPDGELAGSLTREQAVTREFWLLRDYLPSAAAVSDGHAVSASGLHDLLPDARIETVPVPHDCVDGFGAAFWRRPEAYLDPAVRAGISMLAQADPASLADGLTRLAGDVESRAWHERHAGLLERDTLDLGYRLLVTDLG